MESCSEHTPIGYAVHDLEAALKALQALGCHKTGNCNDTTRGVEIAFVEDTTGVCIELVTPLSKNNPVSNILKRFGSCPYHLCFVTELPLEDAVAVLCTQGFKRLPDGGAAPALEGRMVQFLYSPCLGIVELVEKRCN